MDSSNPKPNPEPGAQRLERLDTDGRLLAELENQFKTGIKSAFGPSAVVRRAAKVPTLAVALGLALGPDRDPARLENWLASRHGKWFGNRRLIAVKGTSCVFLERRRVKPAAAATAAAATATTTATTTTTTTPTPTATATATATATTTTERAP
jgi:hypothetical protein